MMAIVIAALRLSGLRNAGTPLDTASTPDSATAPDENARSSIKHAERGRAPRPAPGPPRRAGRAGSGRDPRTKIRQQPDHDQQDEHDDVQVRRRGEQRAALLQAAKVGDRHHGDQREAQRDAPRRVEAERRLDRQHAAGDRHGDGEDVVGEQRGTRHERRRRRRGSRGTRRRRRRPRGRRRSSGGRR